MRISDWSSDVCSSDLGAGFAAQQIFLALLDAGLADLGQPEERAFVGGAQFLLADATDIADEVRRGGPERVVAGQAGIDVDARKLMAIDLVDRKSTRLNSSH